MRAGVWVRVSSAAQDEVNQVPDVERHCEGRGYTITKRYLLHDKSAYHGEQEATLNQVLADIRAGEIKVLVCWHSDRLERRGDWPCSALSARYANARAAGSSRCRSRPSAPWTWAAR